jgi:redox-sensing transcriptional repressor
MLREEGRRVVSSQQMGEMLGIKASQVRKDLSYFGEIGKRGVGYHVDRLYDHVGGILSSPRVWRIGLIGAGHLGRAILGYATSLRSEKFRVEVAFDADPEKVGRPIQGVPCLSADDLTRTLAERQIDVVVLTVPAASAQSVVDRAAAAGTVKGILNFAPAPVVAPEGVLVVGVDISVELEKLLFFLKERGL